MGKVCGRNIDKLSKGAMKLLLLKLYYRIRATFLRLSGVTLGKGCTVSGSIFIRKADNSVIRLGDHCTLHSLRRFNPIMGSQLCLCTGCPGAEISFGAYSGMSGGAIYCVKSITIGEKTIIGADCLIMDTDCHYPAPNGMWASSFHEADRGEPVHIGKSCFIGARSIILKGVTIGDHSVIAAGSVVNQDIPPYSLAGGNPIRIRPLPKHWLPIE